MELSDGLKALSIQISNKEDLRHEMYLCKSTQVSSIFKAIIQAPELKKKMILKCLIYSYKRMSLHSRLNQPMTARRMCIEMPCN